MGSESRNQSRVRHLRDRHQVFVLRRSDDISSLQQKEQTVDATMAFSLQQSYSYHRSNIYDASLATVTAISFVDAVVLVKGLPIIHRLDVLFMVLPCATTIYTFFCRLLQPELINRQIGFPITIYKFIYSYPLLCAIWAVWTRLGKGGLSSHAPVAAIVALAVYCQCTFLMSLAGVLSESPLCFVGFLCCSALLGAGIIVSCEARQKED
jgi:hypothetical protein